MSDTAAAATGTAPAVPAGLGFVAEDLARAALTLARIFHAGGRMWCASPSWPHHARHVAVEFVHPVIVGKRALPAVMIPDDDLVATVRTCAGPGDTVVLIGAADDPEVGGVVRRAPAWGVTTLWIGHGPRPSAGAADHVLWLDHDSLAHANGHFILLYHLLWELTHVCFEHRGLLDAPPDTDGVCITCGDEGILAEVVAVVGDDEAVVRTANGSRTVDTALVGPVAPTDLVVVHAGSAITRLEEP